MAKRVTFADKTNSSTPTGATTEAKAADYNALKDKANNPGIAGTHVVSILADDEVFVKQNNQSGVRNYIKDPGVSNDVGIGNGYHEIFVSDGSAVNFSADFVGVFDSPSAGDTFRLIAIWDGEVFSTTLQNITGSAQLDTPSNFQAVGSDGQVSLSWNAVQSAQGYELQFHDGDLQWANVPGYGGTALSAIHSGLSNGTTYYYRVRAIAGGYNPSAYSETAATPQGGATSLTAPTLQNAYGGEALIQVWFSNPNSGNEDGNQIQYKESTSGTWLDGPLVATSGIMDLITSLVNGTQYDVSVIAKGSGSWTDSPRSNIIQTTVGIVDYSALSNIVCVLDDSGLKLNEANSYGTIGASNNLTRWRSILDDGNAKFFDEDIAGLTFDKDGIDFDGVGVISDTQLAANWSFLVGVGASWAFTGVFKFGNIANPESPYGIFGNNVASASNTGAGFFYRDTASENNGLRTLINEAGASPTRLDDITNDIIPANALQVLQLRWNPDLSTGSLLVYINGSQVASIDRDAAMSGGAAPPSIGMEIGSVGNSALPLLGKCRAAIWQSSINGTQLDNLNTQLVSKYGIT